MMRRHNSYEEWRRFAGLVWSLRPNDLEVELLRISRQVMGRLEEETGIHSGWINNGGLFIASTKERLDEYKRLMTVGIVKITFFSSFNFAFTVKIISLISVGHVSLSVKCE